MMRRGTMAAGGIAVLVLVGAWLGSNLHFGIGTGESSKGGSPRTETTPAEPAEPDPVVDGVLTVQIVGSSIKLASQESTAEHVAQLAKERSARVRIERSADATRRAREDLENALRERQVIYQID